MTYLFREGVRAIYPFAFSLVPLFLLVLYCAWTENAGAVSFTDLFSYHRAAFAAGAPRNVNSQTIALLEAPATMNPIPSVGGDDITIVNDSALLPDAGPLGTIVDVEALTQGTGGHISLYVVRSNDTLSGIASSFGVSVNTILWANDLKKDSVLSPGQTLVILPITGIQYVVKKGDTLAAIAKRFKGNTDEILKFNGITDEAALSAGMTIIIPHGDAPVAVPSSTTALATMPKKKPVQGIAKGVPLAEAPLPSKEPSMGSVGSGGYFTRPVVGGIKTQGLHGWNAVDIAASLGTPILAAADGVVVISRSGGWNGGYGSYVVISHPNGTQTLYAHLVRNLVQEGDHVTQGQPIGLMGETGEATGVHLHFEVRGGVNPF